MRRAWRSSSDSFSSISAATSLGPASHLGETAGDGGGEHVVVLAQRVDGAGSGTSVEWEGVLVGSIARDEVIR